MNEVGKGLHKNLSKKISDYFFLPIIAVTHEFLTGNSADPWIHITYGSLKTGSFCVLSQRELEI